MNSILRIIIVGMGKTKGALNVRKERERFRRMARYVKP